MVRSPNLARPHGEQVSHRPSLMPAEGTRAMSALRPSPRAWPLAKRDGNYRVSGDHRLLFPQPAQQAAPSRVAPPVQVTPLFCSSCGCQRNASPSQCSSSGRPNTTKSTDQNGGVHSQVGSPELTQPIRNHFNILASLQRCWWQPARKLPRKSLPPHSRLRIPSSQEPQPVRTLRGDGHEHQVGGHTSKHARPQEEAIGDGARARKRWESRDVMQHIRHVDRLAIGREFCLPRGIWGTDPPSDADVPRSTKLDVATLVRKFSIPVLGVACSDPHRVHDGGSNRSPQGP